MKKITKWFLVAVMCLGFSVPAFASWTFDNNEYEHIILVRYKDDPNSCVLYFTSVKEINQYGTIFGFLPLVTVSAKSGINDLESRKEAFSLFLSGDDSKVNISWRSSFFDLVTSNDRTYYCNFDFFRSSGNINALYDFLGFSGGDSPSQNLVYDSTIPAPKNLSFTTHKEGGFLGLGGNMFFDLKWLVPSDPNLHCRISSRVSFTAGAESDVRMDLPLLDISDSFPASSGLFSIDEKGIASHLKGGTLDFVDWFRLQYYRVQDGITTVGPISTVHLNRNLFGKYTGYTVTTEYPKDDANIGDSGGLDDFYDGDWSPDGSEYTEYDKDGNVIGSGTSSGSFTDLVNKLVSGFFGIPTLISGFFDSLLNLMSGVGAFPAFFTQLFSWLPPEIVSIIGVGITLVIVLRICGR